MRSFASVSSAALNLQLAEEVLYDLPPLEGVFLYWHTHGVTTTTPGITSLLARREQMLGVTTLSGASIRLLYECAIDCLRRLPVPVYSPWDSRPLHARLLRHSPSKSAAETQALLPPGVLVQKTISVTLGERLLLCTGKIGHELRMERKKRNDESTGIIFIEQLYPWPEAELSAELQKHSNAAEIVWVQEEPANMGANWFVVPRLKRISGGRPVLTVKRSAAASPATGSAKAHDMEQKTLIDLAFGGAK